MKKDNEKIVTIKCNNEQYEELRKRVKTSGLTQTEFILCKILDLSPMLVDEVKEYPNVVKGKDYRQKRLVTKRVLRPV